MKLTLNPLFFLSLIIFCSCANMKDPPEFVIVDDVVVKQAQLVYLNNDKQEVLIPMTLSQDRFRSKAKLKKHVKEKLCLSPQPLPTQTKTQVPKSVFIEGREYVIKDAAANSTNKVPQESKTPLIPVAILVDFDIYDREELNFVKGYRISCVN